MAARSGQKLKILYIIKILTELTDELHPLSADEICAKLSGYGVTAERKSIYNDIECLIDFGYDIVKTRTPKNGYFLASREFELPEIYLLIDAVRTADFISERKTRQLVKKFNNMLSAYQAKHTSSGIYIGGSNKTNNEEIFYNIDTLNTAIQMGKKVSLKYEHRRLGENREIAIDVKEHRVSSYAMTWQDDHYYLIGNNEKYDNLMHMRIDRIKKVELTAENSRHFSEVSDYTDTFDVADYTTKLFGMFGGEIAKIKIRCKKYILEQLTDRFGENIFFTNVTEDTFDISVDAVISEGLVTWIMNYGDKLQIIEPQSLKEKITERAEKILNIYKN